MNTTNETGTMQEKLEIGKYRVEMFYEWESYGDIDDAFFDTAEDAIAYAKTKKYREFVIAKSESAYEMDDVEYKEVK